MTAKTVDPYTGQPTGGTMRVPRSRGLVAGVLLIVLGAWAAFVPFIGHYLHLAYTPTQAWTWTSGRWWYEVLPGAVAFIGGLMLIGAANRVVTSIGAWLGVVAGAWLVIGPSLAPVFTLGSVGRPSGTTTRAVAAQHLLVFYGVGAAILFLGALAVGRLSVRSVRDALVAREAVAARQPVAARQTVAARHSAPVAAPAAAERGSNRPHHRHFHLRRHHTGDAPMETAQPTTAGEPTHTMEPQDTAVHTQAIRPGPHEYSQPPEMQHWPNP